MAPHQFPQQSQPRQPGDQGLMDPQPETRPVYPGIGKLQDQVAIITGGDSGIGRSVAEHYANEGAHVVIVYREEDPDAVAAKEAVEAYGVRCRTIRGDVAERGFCDEVVASTVDVFGRLDVVVANAAEQHIIDDLHEDDDALMERTFASNIFGTMRIVYAALPHLSEGGRIILTTSVVAYKGSAGLVDYSATKGAQVALIRSLSQRLVGDGIRVNGVAPGPIWTPLIPASFSGDRVETFGSKTPMGRAGQPNEVAPAYVFLASRESSYMTGQVLHVDGGMYTGS